MITLNAGVDIENIPACVNDRSPSTILVVRCGDYVVDPSSTPYYKKNPLSCRSKEIISNSVS